jgi:hypothetical protein
MAKECAYSYPIIVLVFWQILSSGVFVKNKYGVKESVFCQFGLNDADKQVQHFT